MMYITDMQRLITSHHPMLFTSNSFIMTSKTPTALLPDSNPSSDQKLMTQSTSSYVKSMDASSNPAQREPVPPVDSIPSPNRNKTRTSLISRSRASPIHVSFNVLCENPESHATQETVSYC